MCELQLYCDNERNPIGIDHEKPVLSWLLMQDEPTVHAKHIQIAVWLLDHAGKEKQALVWRHQCDAAVLRVSYDGTPLCSRRQYVWEAVLETDIENIYAAARFETAFLSSEEWTADWIGLPDSRRAPDHPALDEEGNASPAKPEDMQLLPGYRVRREFYMEHRPVCARLYATAYGIYELYLDGTRIGDYELAPEHTDYHHQLLYQIYDITELLTPGPHTLGVKLASGWYMGRVGFSGEDCQYGTGLGLLLELHCTNADGTEQILCSDTDFSYEENEYRYADLFIGESIDGRRLCPEFYLTGYQSADLKPVQKIISYKGSLIAQPAMHIQTTEVIEPVRIWDEGHSLIADFGTVLAGKACITFSGKSGMELILSHTEMLNKDGTFAKNICEPYKDQEDRYLCADGTEVTYEPRFTYHGFRYVKIDGFEHPSQLIQITAKAITSVMRQTISFCCSDTRLNQLYRNILRSQQSNSVSIPTDCPQREKGGWTGDVQVFSKTACLNQDMRNFYRRWLSDMRFAQREDGAIPIIVPYLPGTKRVFDGIFDSAGWSDAAIVLPWNLYQTYGEPEFLSENYPMMKRWFACMERVAYEENPEDLDTADEKRLEHLHYIRNTGFHFADWLTPSVSMDPVTGELNMMQSAFLTMEIVPTLFYYYMAVLMEQTAEILFEPEDARHYRELQSKIRDAFSYEFLDASGNIRTNLQGICVLAIATGIVTGREKELVYQKFKELLRENGGHLDTGFLSVPFVLDMICQNGEKELAYKLLLSEEYPSWLYEVRMGATGMWEAWNAVLPDGTCNHISLNHYAYGCVGDWIFRHIIGITPLCPGYRRVRIAPDLDSPLFRADGSFLSVSGKIACTWERTKQYASLTISIPDGVSAVLDLPYMELREVTVTDSRSKLRQVSGTEAIELPAGRYQIKGILHQIR